MTRKKNEEKTQVSLTPEQEELQYGIKKLKEQFTETKGVCRDLEMKLRDLEMRLLGTYHAEAVLNKPIRLPALFGQYNYGCGAGGSGQLIAGIISYFTQLVPSGCPLCSHLHDIEHRDFYMYPDTTGRGYHFELCSEK